jgi:hypothetical protein
MSSSSLLSSITAATGATTGTGGVGIGALGTEELTDRAGGSGLSRIGGREWKGMWMDIEGTEGFLMVGIEGKGEREGGWRSL